MREKCTRDTILHIMFQVSDRIELAILSISHSIEMPAQREMLGEKFILSMLLLSLLPQDVKGICQHSTRKCILHLQSTYQPGPWMIEAISQQDTPFIFDLSNNSTLQQLRINNGQSYLNKDSIVRIFPSAIEHLLSSIFTVFLLSVLLECYFTLSNPVIPLDTPLEF